MLNLPKFTHQNLHVVIMATSGEQINTTEVCLDMYDMLQKFIS